jgi:hypothetical protein
VCREMSSSRKQSVNLRTFLAKEHDSNGQLFCLQIFSDI